MEFRHHDLVITNADELPVSILVNLIRSSFAIQPGTNAPTAWLGLLLLLPAALNAASAKPLIEETALFVGGQQGIHTYRIPSMVSTRKGTILVFCEGRRYQVDDGSPTHIVLKRSLGNSAPPNSTQSREPATSRQMQDMKITWQPMQILLPSIAGMAFMNPVPIVDERDGTIFLLANPYPPPYKDVPVHIVLIKSSDEGATWSTPVDITAGTGLKELGPGIGIQMQSGRLVAPTYDGVIFSDDHGKTWKSGGKVSGLYSESQAVELVDGSLMLNFRQGGHRAIVVSQDAGMTWGKSWIDMALIDPTDYVGCQASFIRYSRKRAGISKNRLLFSNPANPTHRVNMTVRISYDEGKTWPVAKEIKKGPGGYSSLTVLPDGTIALVYESSDPLGNIDFARFNLEWLTDGQDQLASQ